MKKKILAVVLCVVFTWGACAFWAFAPALADATRTGTTLWDCLAVVSLFAGLCCSCIYNDERKKGRETEV